MSVFLLLNNFEALDIFQIYYIYYGEKVKMCFVPKILQGLWVAQAAVTERWP